VVVGAGARGRDEGKAGGEQDGQRRARVEHLYPCLSVTVTSSVTFS
jgi:hypothetical protein